MINKNLSHSLVLLILCALLSCKKSENSAVKEGNSKEDDNTEEVVKEVVKPDKVVAADGSGDYTTVQAAVNAAPANATKNYIISIKNGTYKEVITVPKNKNYIYFIGEDADKTILTYNNYAAKLDGNGAEYGTSGSASVFIKATNFTVQNITFENSSGIDAGQALAINIGADKAAFKNCRFLGNQDTFNAADHTTQYLKDCYIAGTVDFMFGGSVALFDNCVLHSLRDGYLTAASTPAGQKYGYVYLNCKITAAATVKDGSVYLGRPWRPNSNVVYIKCEMGKHIIPAGWSNWSNPENEKTAYYAEYKSTGPGYQPGKRQSWSHQLTDTEANEYTVEKILGTWAPVFY